MAGATKVALSGNNEENLIEYAFNAYPGEVPRVLFLGICLDFYYFLWRVLLPKFGALRNLDVRVGTMDLAVATLTPGSFS